MKAIIKRTKKEIEVVGESYNGTNAYYRIISDGKETIIPQDEVQILECIDWEQRRFEAAEHILAAMLVNPSVGKGDIKGLAKLSIKAADTLIVEFNNTKN